MKPDPDYYLVSWTGGTRPKAFYPTSIMEDATLRYREWCEHSEAGERVDLFTFTPLAVFRETTIRAWSTSSTTLIQAVEKLL